MWNISCYLYNTGILSRPHFFVGDISDDYLSKVSLCLYFVTVPIIIPATLLQYWPQSQNCCDIGLCCRVVAEKCHDIYCVQFFFLKSIEMQTEQHHMLQRWCVCKKFVLCRCQMLTEPSQRGKPAICYCTLMKLEALNILYGFDCCLDRISSWNVRGVTINWSRLIYRLAGQWSNGINLKLNKWSVLLGWTCAFILKLLCLFHRLPTAVRHLLPNNARTLIWVTHYKKLKLFLLIFCSGKR